jgi:hypothetical protein
MTSKQRTFQSHFDFVDDIDEVFYKGRQKRPVHNNVFASSGVDA